MPVLLRKLDRYVLREMLSPFFLGVLVWTFILLMDALFDAAETIIQRHVPSLLVGKLLALSLPHIIVLTIPMAFLFAILIAVGRLAADSELVALRASGVSLFSLYRPVLLLSLALAAVNCWLMIDLLPWGNHAQQNLLNQIMARSVSEEIAPRVFHELGDRVLYVFERDPTQWRGVFVAEAVPKTQQRITVAETGDVRVDEKGEQAILTLNNATDQELNLLDPKEVKISQYRTLDLRLEDQLLRRRSQVSSSRWVRELSWAELRSWASDPERPAIERNSAQVEIQKKFAIPAACLVFGLFGVPLGFNNRRGGSKSSGFAVSIAVILVYYVLLNNGEEAATVGKASAVAAMWMPNLLFTVAGTFLLARRNRDKSLLLTRVDRWVRQHLWMRLRVRRRVRELRRLRRQRLRWEAALSRRQQLGVEGSARSQVVLKLPRPRLLFPNLFDRYIFGLFARVFSIVLLAGTSIYVVANLTQLLDDILRNHIAGSVVFDYYKYLSLQIFYTISPIIVLLTTLVTFALLSRSNEVIAAKALGLSLYRLAVPAVMAALLVAGLSAVLESSVLPASNARVAELKDQIRGETHARSYRRADRQWLFGKGDYIYNFLHYDPDRRLLQRLQIFRFDAQHRLTGRLYAEQAQYDGQRWMVSAAWARQFDEHGGGAYTPLPGPQPVDIPEEPAFFDTELKSPDQMNYPELRSYIRELRSVGQHVPELEVELHNKLAMPVVCVVMALVALPFAFRLGKAGALYGIGLALVLGMVYYGILAFFTTLGSAAALPPAVAAWSPNVFFALFSLYLFLGVRT